MDVLCFGAVLDTVFVIWDRDRVSSKDGIHRSTSNGRVVFLGLIVIHFICGDRHRRSLLLRVHFVSTNGALHRGGLCVRGAELRDDVFAAKAFSVVFLHGCREPSTLHFVLLDHTQCALVNVYRSIPRLIHFAVRDVRHPRRRVVQGVFRVAARARPQTYRQGVIYNAFALDLGRWERVHGVLSVPYQGQDRWLRAL